MSFTIIVIPVASGTVTRGDGFYVDHKTVRVFDAATHDCIGIAQRIGDDWRVLI